MNFSNEVVDVLGLYIKPKNLALFTVYRQPDNRAGGNRSTSVHFKEALDKLNEVLMNYRGPLHGLMVMARTDGLMALQSGLLPACLYQVTVSTKTVFWFFSRPILK